MTLTRAGWLSMNTRHGPQRIAEPAEEGNIIEPVIDWGLRSRKILQIPSYFQFDSR